MVRILTTNATLHYKWKLCHQRLLQCWIWFPLVATMGPGVLTNLKVHSIRRFHLINQELWHFRSCWFVQKAFFKNLLVQFRIFYNQNRQNCLRSFWIKFANTDKKTKVIKKDLDIKIIQSWGKVLKRVIWCLINTFV